MKVTLTKFPLDEAVAGNQLLHVFWKKQGDPDISYVQVADVTIDANGNIVSPSPYTFNTNSDDPIVVKTVNDCDNLYLFTKNFPGLQKMWIGDTYHCTQSSVFTETARRTGLSSPVNMFYHSASGRMYVMDQDDVNGVFWYFTPNPLPSPIDKTTVPATNVCSQAYATVADCEYNRLYATGRWGSGSPANAGGLLVHDLTSGTVNTINYGTNGSNNFSRVTLTVQGNIIYAGDRSTSSIILINRDTLTINSTIALSSVPSGPGGKTLSANARLSFVNGEIWAWEDGETNSVNNVILRFNTALTQYLGMIDTSMYRAIWSFNTYWGTVYYDQEKNKFYATDNATRDVIVINTNTLAIETVFTIPNVGGREGARSSIVSDPITGDLYLVVKCTNRSTGQPDILKSYRIDRDNFAIIDVFPDVFFNQLERVGTTNLLYGADPGQPAWNNVPGWDTDGIVIQFTR